MTTLYTPNLKLALPANGELAGAWGTVVNDNITSMVEEAITGRASVSSWVANAATIVTADGTTSAGRAMMLDLSGTLTAAGTLTVPTANKMFIVKNGTTGGFAVTVKMATGTGVSVPNGATMFVYADGTNVIRAAGDVDLSSAQTLTNKTISGADNTLTVRLANDVTGTLPVANGGTGITSFGSGVATFLGTPSSANLATVVTDETGSGALVFANSPALAGVPTAPTAAVGTNSTQIASTAHVFAERSSTATLTNKTIVNKLYQSSITAVSALDVNCSAGNYFTKTINGNSTFTFSNAPNSVAYGFMLELTHTSGTVTWPANVKWPYDSAPSLTAGKTHLFVFITDDSGSRWRGAALVDYTN